MNKQSEKLAKAIAYEAKKKKERDLKDFLIKC